MTENLHTHTLVILSRLETILLAVDQLSFRYLTSTWTPFTLSGSQPQMGSLFTSSKNQSSGESVYFRWPWRLRHEIADQLIGPVPMSQNFTGFNREKETGAPSGWSAPTPHPPSESL